METARHRNIRKRSRQIEKKEKLILGGTLETDPKLVGRQTEQGRKESTEIGREPGIVQ